MHLSFKNLLNPPRPRVLYMELTSFPNKPDDLQWPTNTTDRLLLIQATEIPLS